MFSGKSASVGSIQEHGLDFPHAVLRHRVVDSHVLGRSRNATGEERLEVVVAVYQLSGKVVRLVLELLGDDVGVAVHKNPVHTLVNEMVGQFVGADEALLLLVQI